MHKGYYNTGYVYVSSNDGASFGTGFFSGNVYNSMRFAVLGSYVYMVDRKGNSYRSSDGTTWTMLNNPSTAIFASDNVISLVSLNGYLYCIYVDWGDSSRAHVWRSSDAINWTLIFNQADNYWGINGSTILTAYEHGGAIYLHSYNLNYHSVFYSTDGINWTGKETTVNGSSSPMHPECDTSEGNLVSYDNKLWFLGGYNVWDAESVNDISYMASQTSSDTYWQRVTPITSPFPASRYRISCVHNGHVYVTGGYNDSAAGLWRSCTEEEADLGIVNVRNGGSWIKGTVWANQSGTWVKAKKVHAKNGGVWLPSS